MKAVKCTRYGGPEHLRIEEVERPAPQGRELRVKVHAASVNAGDWRIMRGEPALMRLAFGLRQPRFSILGMDAAGRVDAVGENVQNFKPGDAVFADLSRAGFGAFAEYVCANEQVFASIPEGVSFEEAAALPTAGATALQGLRKGQVGAGQRVLIHGASGGIGTYAVQLAKQHGAHVTAVCSGRHVGMIRRLGADAVINYEEVDFAEKRERYDLIFGVNGDRSIWDYRRALEPTGRYVMSGGSTKQLFQAMLLGPLLSMVGGQKFGNFLVRPSQADLQELARLTKERRITPEITGRYPLAQVPEAIRTIEAGHTPGKLIICIAA